MRRDTLIATIYLLGGAGGGKVSMSEVMEKETMETIRIFRES